MKEKVILTEISKWFISQKCERWVPTRRESRNGAEAEHKSRIILWSKGCWAVLPTLKHHLEAVLWMSSVSSAQALNRGCHPADCWMDDRSRFRSSWEEEVYSSMRPNCIHGCCSLILTWDQFIVLNYSNYQSDWRQSISIKKESTEPILIINY